MAQAGYTPISIYYSATGAAVPSAGNLVAGELALNTNDGKLYYKNSSGVVTLLAGATSGPAGGSTTQVQYNNAGVLAGITGATTNGTALTLVAPVLGTPASGTVTNLTGTASININGTVGATTPAAGAFTTLSATGDVTVTKNLPALVLQPNTGTYSNIQMRGNATIGLGLDILAGAQNAYFSADSLTFRSAASVNYGVFSSTGLAVTGTLSATLDATIYGVTVGRGAGGGSVNTVVGAGALAGSNTGNANTAIGGTTLAVNTSGNYLTAVGYNTLAANTTGVENTAIGSGSATIFSTMRFNTSGSYNTAVGNGSLGNNSTGSANTAVGYQASYTNTVGVYCTAVGYQALYSNTANNNTAVGQGSLYTNSSGTSNVAMGNNALNLNSTGSSNTAIGLSALEKSTTASNNTAVGYQAGYANTTGRVDAVGYQAALANTTGRVIAFGRGAAQSNTSGAVVAVGEGVLAGNTTGVGNTGVGGTYNVAPPLNANTTGSQNTAVGEGALSGNTTASNNTAVGYQAGYAYTGTTGYNTFYGWQAGTAVTTGSVNTYIGPGAGNLMTSGAKNTILGAYNGNSFGLDIRTADNYIVLSDGDGNPRGIFDGSGNLLVGGTSLVGSGKISITFSQSSNQGVSLKNSSAGNAANYILFLNSADAQSGIIAQTGATSVVYTTTSDYRLKKNQEPLTNSGNFIDALKPKTWEWVADGSKASGFIAHEFSEISPLSVFGEKDATREEEYEISPAIPATQDEEGNEITAAVEAVKGNRTVPVYQGMQASSSEVIANMVAELQSLRKRITALENK